MKVFSPVKINTMTCSNRFLRSATWEALSNREGYISEGQKAIYVELAKNHVGLICTGYARVDANEYPNAGMMGIYDDCFIPQYQELTDAVHQENAKIMMQIAYGGTKTTYEVEGRTILAPSAVEEKSTGVMGTEMTAADIKEMVRKYAEAARRVKASGFDAVQIHSGHSYLLNQVLSPYYNRRTDAYGGSLENRYRMLDEIIQAMRKEVGEEYPIAIKITCSEFFEGGLAFEEVKTIVGWLEKSGIDMIEVSGNIHGKAQKMIGESFDGHTIQNGGFFADYAKELAELVEIPVYVTGGFSEPEHCEELLQDSKLAGIGFSRPLLSEPDLILRWENGDTRKARCIHCSKCRTKEGNYCTVFDNI